ncbi:hypothetical protein FACS189472_00760 [Alphaproteobacteria bacterium]|nr:hypothetical protein FACS189472_00760 [Alphaproteobacteria bacterium]
MSNEITSILEEINEELKHDQQMAFFKKHSTPILVGIIAIVVFILAYSTWHTRRQKHMEDITTALISINQSPGVKSDLLLQELIDRAPGELKPILMVIKSGKQLSLGEFSLDIVSPLLELQTRSGVDIIWKDLALLVYASYPLKSSDELIKMLEPLTAEDRPFRFTALELIGMINENDGKHTEALEVFDKIVNDKSVPRTQKNRISIVSNYIRNSMGKQNETV